MTRTERHIINLGIGGSLAVHLLFGVSAGVLINDKMFLAPVKLVPPPEPEVTMIYPQDLKLEPAPPPQPKKDPEQYIRTTQNSEASAPPEKADFISDKNTVASAKNAPDPAGNVPLPSMKGMDLPTLELANRDYADGKIKNDSAPSPPPGQTAPPPKPIASLPKPEMRQPEPEPPRQEMVKKEDTPVEKMLLDTVADKKPDDNDHLPEQVKPPQPVMKAPQDDPPVPKAIPVAKPLANTPRHEEDSFMPQTRVSNVKGSIANRGGEDAVNAVRTLAGRYDRTVQGAIEQRWHKDVNMKMVYMKPGKIGLRFFVSKDGTVRKQDVSVIFDEGGPMLKESALSAIFNAKLPPIPDDLLPMLDKERFEVNCHFIYR